jgi:alpha-ribazole phosphatase
MMLRLLLVRHGETASNAERRFSGVGDVPLNNRGREQALALREALRAEEIHLAYSSDLVRALETAEAIAGGRPLGVVPTPDLRELDFGEWEGMTHDEIRRRDPEALRDWEADPFRIPPPGGESLERLDRRVGWFMAGLGDRHRGQTVLIVAHAGPIRVLLCRSLGLPPQAHWQFGVGPGSLSELGLYPEGSVLVSLNHSPPRLAARGASAS